MVERAIRTSKGDIFKRVERNFEKPWDHFLPDLLNKYSYKDVHSVIGMTPFNATKKGNHFEVAMNLNTNKRQDRVYEPLKVGDKVKIYSKVKFKKQQTSVWSDNAYTINKVKESLSQKFYRLEGMPKMYTRHELLLTHDK